MENDVSLEKEEESQEESREELLSANDILSANDYRYVDVDVSKWWGTGKKGLLRIRALAADEALHFFKSGRDDEETMIKLVSKCAVDVNGDRLFTDDQVRRLRKKSFAAFIKIQDEAMKLNGMGERLDKVKNV